MANVAPCLLKKQNVKKKIGEKSKLDTPAGATGKEVWLLLKEKGYDNARGFAHDMGLELSVFSKEYLSKETIKVLVKYQNFRSDFLLFREGEPFASPSHVSAVAEDHSDLEGRVVTIERQMHLLREDVNKILLALSEPK